MKVITSQNIAAINIQKIMPNLIQGSFFQVKGGEPPEKILEDRSKSQEILTPGSEVSLKDTTQNFLGQQIVEHIRECQKLTSNKVVLQMVKGDTIKFENDIPTKHNVKYPSFSTEEEVEIQVILEKMLHKRIKKLMNLQNLSL